MPETSGSIEIFKPQNREELWKVLNSARETSKKVYVTSGPLDVRHIDCKCDYGITLINLEHEIKVDHNTETVLVGVAVSVKKVQSILAEHGLRLPCVPSNTESTVGEALNSCLHSSGSNVGILSSYVQEMEVMTSWGETLTVGEGNELLGAASLGLGLVGVPLTVTLITTRKCPLHVTRYTIDLHQLLENFAVHCSSSDYFSFTWIPEGGCTVRHCRPNTACIAKSSNGVLRDLLFTVYEQASSWFSCLFGACRLQSWSNKVLFYLGYSRNLSYIDKSGSTLSNATPGRLYYTEQWFVPRHLVPLAVYELEAVILNRRLPVHRVDVRLVRGDNLYLSPATGGDSAAISISVTRSQQHGMVYDQIYSTVDEILQQQGARPSWQTDAIKTKLGDLYPDCSKFTTARDKMDPFHTLVSPYLRLLAQSIQ